MSPWKIRHNNKIEVYLELKLNYIKKRENEKYIFSFGPKFYLEPIIDKFELSSLQYTLQS